MLVVAAEDYTGLSPNKTPYASAPRYLDEHVAALHGGRLRGRDDRRRQPAGGPERPGRIEADQRTSACCRTSTRSSTTPATTSSRRRSGQGVTAENYRRGNTPGSNGTFGLIGSTHLPNWGVRNAHMLRNYMNDGGKVLMTGRNVWVQQTTNRSCTECGLNSYSGYSWWQDPVYGFDYPPNQEGDDDRPHTAFFRELDMPNDWGQWWLGFGIAREGIGHDQPRASGRPERGRPARRHADLLARHIAGLRRDAEEPTQDALTGAADPRMKVPTRLRAMSSHTIQRPLRQERIDADYSGVANANGGAILSTRDSVSLGFGLEQIASTSIRNGDRAARAERTCYRQPPTRPLRRSRGCGPVTAPRSTRPTRSRSRSRPWTSGAT